jgi:3',5'-cyclic-AMP phosphodiesterase
MKLIQLTDLHLMPAGERLHDLDPQARLDAAIADINAHQGDAALCVLSGDLANAGDVPSYQALRASLARLRVPWRLMVGNHDDRANLLRVFPDTPLDAHGFVQTRVELDGARLLLLDTLEPGQAWGRYCARRLSWLETELAAAESRPVYLFTHHPPFPIGLPSLDRMTLRDDGPLGALLERHGGVRHLFCGHVHRPIAGSWRGIPVSALPSTNHQVAFDLVTVAPVPDSPGPPAYGVIFIGPDTTIVHMHDFLGGGAPAA